MNITSKIREMADTDLFELADLDDSKVGNLFYLDYEKASLLIPDAYKNKVGGIPQGSFLLAYYENEENHNEALLLRAINPTSLPTDDDNVRSMIEYYKDDIKTSGTNSQLDAETKYQFSFSGLECYVLGTFYRGTDNELYFGADLENFFGSHNYSVFKPFGKYLQKIVNFRDGETLPGNPTDVRIGKVRYSSSLRFAQQEEDIPVFINPKDFLGKRTAMFGMTRTGKSNTVKKIIEATSDISTKSEMSLADPVTDFENALKPLMDSGAPKYPVGQIIFDINGEYANKNLQDGTAIFEMFSDATIRYSVIPKEGFKVMRVNFYKEIQNGFELIRGYFSAIGSPSGYMGDFLSVDLEEPADYSENNKGSAATRYERKIAAYKCCLWRAGFTAPDNAIVKFPGAQEINTSVIEGRTIDPSRGISLEDAGIWFDWVWENYDTHEIFSNYKKKKGREWADEDLKNLLVLLSRFRSPGKKNGVRGFLELKRQDLLSLHTELVETSFEKDIIESLREGKIIIVDLSQGNPEVQKTFSEKICRTIFQNSMRRFTSATPNNFIQFYFEEAHNLFPKKEDKDLSQIYNRIAKEGAKLSLGMIYATQEVSSISSNILKNTQNWFIAHLNNDDELRELRKYYDFSDFANSLVRFSARNDKGFVRMKSYSNPFTVPVQIDKFEN